MTRPIVWAAMTLCSVALGASFATDRLAGRGSGPEGISTASVGTGAGERVVTVSADLAGHFIVHPQLDGARLRMMVDTGATSVVLTAEDARGVGLRLSARDFTRKVATANGTVEAASVRIREMRLGEIVVRDVEALVLPEGRLGTSLLGMSFLRRIGGFEISRGRLTLRG